MVLKYSFSTLMMLTRGQYCSIGTTWMIAGLNSQSLLCSAFSAKVQAMPPRCFMLSESWKEQWGDSRLDSCSEVLLLHNYPVTFCRCFALTLAMEDQIALRLWVSSCPLCCDKMPHWREEGFHLASVFRKFRPWLHIWDGRIKPGRGVGGNFVLHIRPKIETQRPTPSAHFFQMNPASFTF